LKLQLTTKVNTHFIICGMSVSDNSYVVYYNVNLIARDCKWFYIEISLREERERERGRGRERERKRREERESIQNCTIVRNTRDT